MSPPEPERKTVNGLKDRRIKFAFLLSVKISINIFLNFLPDPLETQFPDGFPV